MPPFYCDYCDVYLTHDSSSVRKSHNLGRNHLLLIKEHFQKVAEEHAQENIDRIAAVHERGQIVSYYRARPMRNYYGQIQLPPPPTPLPQLPQAYAFPPRSGISATSVAQPPLNVIQPGVQLPQVSAPGATMALPSEVLQRLSQPSQEQSRPAMRV